MPREIKSTENHRNKDEKAIDQLDLKLRVACMINSPYGYEKVSNPLWLEHLLIELRTEYLNVKALFLWSNRAYRRNSKA